MWLLLLIIYMEYKTNLFLYVDTLIMATCIKLNIHNCHDDSGETVNIMMTKHWHSQLWDNNTPEGSSPLFFWKLVWLSAYIDIMKHPPPHPTHSAISACLSATSMIQVKRLTHSLCLVFTILNGMFLACELRIMRSNTSSSLRMYFVRLDYD